MEGSSVVEDLALLYWEDGEVYYAELLDRDIYM